MALIRDRNKIQQQDGRQYQQPLQPGVEHAHEIALEQVAQGGGMKFEAGTDGIDRSGTVVEKSLGGRADDHDLVFERCRIQDSGFSCFQAHLGLD